jgi:hypothetical protein
VYSVDLAAETDKSGWNLCSAGSLEKSLPSGVLSGFERSGANRTSCWRLPTPRCLAMYHDQPWQHDRSLLTVH